MARRKITMTHLILKQSQVLLVCKEDFVLNYYICLCFVLLYYTVDETNNDEYNGDPPDIETVSGMYLYFMYNYV